MKQSNPVVIVGIGGCFPEAVTPSAYWKLISEGANVARTMPHSRTMIPIESVHHKGEPTLDKVVGTSGYFVDHESLSLDFEQLDIDPALIIRLDPMFKIGLYAAAQAWKDTKTGYLDKSCSI